MFTVDYNLDLQLSATSHYPFMYVMQNICVYFNRMYNRMLDEKLANV